jgi:flagellar hook-length control protein FliK
VNALASVAVAADRPALRPVDPAASGGFGEAWNAARSGEPAPAGPGPASPAPAASRPDQAAANDPSHAGANKPDGAKPAAKRSKGAAATDDLAVAQAPSSPTGPPAADPDLVALQTMIAAIAGGSPAATRTPAAATGPAVDGGEGASGLSATTLAADDGLEGLSLGPALAGFTLDVGAAPAGSAAIVPDAVSTGIDPPAADLSVVHQLDLAGDGAWLDQLTRDIARSADGSGQLRFSLAPEHLGRLDVQLAATADGTAIRLVAETREAHRIVADAQPQLVAEARAQGLRISETHVDLNNNGSSGAGHQSFGNQNEGGRGQPQRRAGGTEAGPGPAPAAAPDAVDALYA